MKLLPAFAQTNLDANPIPQRKNRILDILKQASPFFNSEENNPEQTNNSYSPRRRRGASKANFIVLGVLAFFLIIVVFIVGNSLRTLGVSKSVSSDTRIAVKGAKTSQNINKEFQFPLKDEKGVEVSRLKFFIPNAEVRDEIIIKGQRASAVEGRTFLIINLKITNSYQKSVSINSRDYFRLSVNNSDEKLAPDIHNDPVEIQPISTKYTRVGFPINETDKNLVLHVGEIIGKKEDIKLTVQ